MSEALNLCKALAAVVGGDSKPNVDEVRFVAHAALELGLAPDQNQAVQSVLAEGGDFAELIKGVESDSLRLLLFRSLVGVTLVDDHINEAEHAYIKQAAAEFGYDQATVDDFIGWMKDGIAWETRGVDIMSRL